MKIYQIIYTIKDLEPIQILYRLKYIVKRRYIEKRSDHFFKKYLSEASKETKIYKYDSLFVLNSRQYYKGDLTSVINNRITFLNHTIDFGKRIDWHLPELNRGTRLWKLNLNYHEFLVDIARESHGGKDAKFLDYLKKTIEDWFTQNPLGTENYGKDNWNSYAISLRLVAWIKILHILKDVLEPSFKEKMIISLRAQAKFLYDNLELDILGNHLLKNWKALAWCGHFLEEPKYKAKANYLFNNYIRKQFSQSGMHEELSPMYAGIVLEDLLEVFLFNRNNTKLKDLIKKQFNNLKYLTNEGQYLFFNDSVNQNEVQPTDLEDFYYSIFENLEGFEQTFEFDGYLGFKNKHEHLVFDAGAIVLGKQPGHAHCDALSFEYVRNGQKIFTNSGTYEYNFGTRRTYSRSTEAHNTLKFDKSDQSEMWSSFRVARKASIDYNLHSLSPDSIDITGKVKGFDFSNPVTHERRLVKHQETLSIKDSFRSNKPRKGENGTVYFHLAPPFEFKVDDDALVIRRGEATVATLEVNFPFRVEKTEFYPEFGRVELKSTLLVEKVPEGEICHTKIKFIK